MDKENYKKLFQKHLNNDLSKEELLQFIDQSELNKDLFMEEMDSLDIDSLNGEFKENELFDKLVNSPAFKSEDDVKIKKIWLPKLLKIAAMLLTFGSLSLISYYYIYNGKATKNIVANSSPKNNILLSGKNSVTIQLTNGEKILIDEADFSDKIAKDGIVLTKDEDGAILFKISDTYVASKNSGFHTFSTPKGESFAFILPDGSKIWLNSSTQLKIPANFNTNSRDVFLEGEAYFDVAHNANKPFKIHSGNDVVKVLGTAFNIKAYHNDSYIYTTLLRGSVQLTTANNDTKLVPGEQAKTNNKTGALSKKHIDTEQVIGWKNGYFKFADQPISSILEELKRWYDIESIEYQTTNKERFTASIKRTRSLADVLNKIEKVSRLKFKIEEGRVIVVE